MTEPLNIVFPPYDEQPAPKRPAASRRPAGTGLLTVVCVVVSLGIVQQVFLLGQSVVRTAQWVMDARAEQALITELREDVRALRDVVSQSAAPEGMRELARCQGFVGMDEDVLVDVAAAPGGRICGPRPLIDPVRPLIPDAQVYDGETPDLSADAAADATVKSTPVTDQ